VTHLRRHLEQTGALAADQLDAALRRQQIYGGSLDTVLLELDIVDAHTLEELLQQACGLPIVPVDLIDDDGDRPIGAIPDELVSIGWAVPLGYQGDRLQVAVHPDLPNERLGALYRTVPGVIPMVTTECAREKMAAELTRSVVPQRYAVLCAAYLSALRRRPSVSDASHPLIPLPTTTEDTARTPRPEYEPSAPAARESKQDTRRTQFYRPADIQNAIEATRMRHARRTRTGDTLVPTLPPPPTLAPPPVADAPLAPPPVAVPPVRYSVRETGTAARLEARFEEGEATRRMTGAVSALRSAKSRDEILDALVRGAMIVSSRVALFRIKPGELQGLSTPRTGLPDLGTSTIAVAGGSDLESALGRSSRSGPIQDAPFRAALAIDAPIPSMTLRIDVAGRPTLLLYLDHAGREFEPGEASALETLASAASDTLEELIKVRRSPPPADAPALGTDSAGTLPPEGPAAIIPPSLSDTARGLAPPPTFGVLEPAHWGPVPTDVSGSDSGYRAPGDEPGVPRRTTQLDGSGSSGPLSIEEPKTTVTVTPPPAPVDPAPSFGTGPAFVPPELDAPADAGIISLAAPMGGPTARGRLDLDEVAGVDSRRRDLEDEARNEAIDRAVEAVARGHSDPGTLAEYGDAAAIRLAVAFPGPLEVLRRDLRALPPPSAHGPYIRLAIRMGPRIVPHIVGLFVHPDPDVRFYAAFLFQELRDPRCMNGLAGLAFDGSGDVRVISMRVLETYSRSPDFDQATARVRQELDGTNRTRQLYAARAVGTLRDVAAIPDLIELLASKDRFIQEAALESLCSITGQQHGLKPHRWRTWYDEHGSEHRIEWIIQSLRHRDLPVRRWAHDELIRVTGHRIPFSPMGDKSAREIAVASWTDWWNTGGRARFTGPLARGGYAG
jgi:HEAT repeat protein